MPVHTNLEEIEERFLPYDQLVLRCPRVWPWTLSMPSVAKVDTYSCTVVGSSHQLTFIG